jgi:hypothetical protein
MGTGIPCVTDCVLAELEKLGHRYRVALRCVLFRPRSPSYPRSLLLTSRLSLCLIEHPQRRPRPALRAPHVLAPGHVRGRLPRAARGRRQVLHRRDVRPRAPPARAQDPRRAAHVYRPPPVRDRAPPGRGRAAVARPGAAPGRRVSGARRVRRGVLRHGAGKVRYCPRAAACMGMVYAARALSFRISEASCVVGGAIRFRHGFR